MLQLRGCALKKHCFSHPKEKKHLGTSFYNALLPTRLPSKYRMLKRPTTKRYIICVQKHRVDLWLGKTH